MIFLRRLTVAHKFFLYLKFLEIQQFFSISIALSLNKIVAKFKLIFSRKHFLSIYDNKATN